MKYQLQNPAYKKRLWILGSLAWALWMLGAWLFTANIYSSQTHSEIRDRTNAVYSQTDSIIKNISHDFENLHGIPAIIAREPLVLNALTLYATNQYPILMEVKQKQETWGTNTHLKKLDEYLHYFSSLTSSDSIFLINTQGDCIASSNALENPSFVGSNFADREYFRSAMHGKNGHQYAVGKVSNIPGLYFSAPVIDGEKVIGVVVSKISMPKLSHWINQSIAFLTDDNGVIIFAYDPVLEMRALPNAKIFNMPIADKISRYKLESFNPLKISTWEFDGDKSLIHFENEHFPSLLVSREFANDGIKLHVMSQMPNLVGLNKNRWQQFIFLSLFGLMSMLLVGSRIYASRISSMAVKKLQDNEDRLNEAQSIANVGSYVLDIRSGNWESSAVLDRIFGIDSLYDRTVSGWDELLHPNDRGAMNSYLLNEVIGKKKAFDKEMRWLHGLGKLVVNIDGKPIRMHGTIQDITERKNVEAEIHRLAFYDALTNLPNRRLLEDRLNQSLAACKRNGSFGVLMMLDLDNFKPLNDTYGHSAGDLLLIEVANRLRECVREIDAVSRFGGDEFVIMLNDLGTNIDQARSLALSIAEKIRTTLATPYQLTTRDMQNDVIQIEHQCTASIGCAMFSGKLNHPNNVIKYADSAMYKAKTSGRNQIAFADECL